MLLWKLFQVLGQSLVNRYLLAKNLF